MKKKTKMNLKVLLCLLLTILCHDLYAQLTPFTITVLPKHQTCLGNGGLTISVNGASQDASLEFEVYLLPNTTQPVTTVTTTTVSGLIAGDYQVLATQTFNGQSNTAQGTATINNNNVPFAFNTTVVNANCNTGGSITVNVYSGSGSQYEIISGPQTFPLQSSNVFENLPAGQYQIRAFDTCGDALVTTVTIATQSGGIIINNPSILNGGELLSCTTTMVSYSAYSDPATSGQIVYPLAIQYKVYPPGGGAPTIINDLVTSGSADSVYITKEIPFYNAQTYLYDIIITDGCGNIFSRLDNIAYAAFDFQVYKWLQFILY